MLSFWSLQKIVQVADYKGFKKPYKTCLKLIICVFWKAQHFRNCKKALDVCKKIAAINRAFREIAKKRYTYAKNAQP